MNSLRFGKSTLSIAAGVVFLALFTATSRSTFFTIDSATVEETIALDAEGKAAGVLTVRLNAQNTGEDPDSIGLIGLEGSFGVTGPEARKSLTVSKQGSDEGEYKVRKSASFSSELSDCWADGEQPEEIVDCELSIGLAFEGKKNAEEPVTFGFEMGGWDGDAFFIEGTIQSVTWAPAT